MKTELELVQQVVNPGRKIKVVSYPTRNYLLHQTCEPIVQLALGLIESDSANSMAQNSALETRNFWMGWNLVKVEWAQAKEFRDAPHAVHEMQYDILVPHVNEVMSISNVKCKRVVQQLVHLVRCIVGLDSGRMQTFVGGLDIEKVELLLVQAEKVLLTYFGTGLGDSSKGFDTGLSAPEYAYGQLIPDIDRNAGSVWEPSSEHPVAPVADVADLESLAPAPGSKQS